MKNSYILYVFVFVLLIFGFISGKATIKKMQDSGKEVDLIYMKLNSRFEKIEKILTELERPLANDFPILSDSIQLDTMSGLAKVNDYEIIDFEFFNANLPSQLTLLEKTDIVLNLSVDRQAIHSKEIDDYQKSLLTLKKQIETLTKEYNYQARLHNSFIKKFPRNFYSSFFHFQSKPYY